MLEPLYDGGFGFLPLALVPAMIHRNTSQALNHIQKDTNCDTRVQWLESKTQSTSLTYSKSKLV